MHIRHFLAPRGDFIMFQSGAVRQLASIPAPSKQQSAAPIWPLRFRPASEGRILSLLCSLTAEQRRARFGTQLADRAIESWRATIDREFYLPVTYEQGSQLVGLVELFGCRTAGWKRPELAITVGQASDCLLYTSPSPRDRQKSRMPSSA